MPRRRNVDLCRRCCQASGCVLYVAILTCLGCVVSTGINVALHAQVPPSTDMVVGSAVTMAGVRQALLRRHRGSGNAAGGKDGGRIVEGRISEVKIAHAQIFYPFEYDGLHERPWDLVIIEGWFKMINVFIHEVRAISYPRPVTVLFYCLDPQFPGLQHVSALDVDGFMTNSESTRALLNPSAPTALVPLAVDTKRFRFFPEPPHTGADTPDGTVARRHEGGKVVYVGAAGALEYKCMLAWMLREAAPYGLDIYGSGWQDTPEFSGYWRGVLPEEQLASVYGGALAVIGVTMDAQRTSGMINNRVFETMSVGAPLISEHFPALEALFGDTILYARRPGDVARHIEHLLRSGASDPGRNEIEASARRRRRTIIEDSHTWERRVEDMLTFAASLSGRDATFEEEGGTTATCSRRHGCLTLALVIDPHLRGDVTFLSTFSPAVDLLTSAYRITWWMAPMDSLGGHTEEKIGGMGAGGTVEAGGEKTNRWGELRLPHDFERLSEFDIVWAVGQWGGPADRTVRELFRRGAAGPRVTTQRLAAQLRGMVLWGSLCTSVDVTGDERGSSKPREERKEGCPDYGGAEGLRWYDVVYCQTGWDHSFLMQTAFDGAVSSNVQQAWGFGASPLSTDSDDGQGLDVRNPPVLCDTLVVGAYSQLPDMLRFLKPPGVTSVVLVVVISQGDLATWSGLESVLSTAGVNPERDGTFADTANLPQRVSLHSSSSDPGDQFTPAPQKSTHIFFVRDAADAKALAEMAAGAERVVIVATGQVGAWATMATAVNGRHHRGKGDAQSFESADSDGRLQALVDEWPEKWDVGYYSGRLMAGVTRAFCLGRGTSRISLVCPAEASSTVVVGAFDTVTVEVSVEDFDVGRDGQWCITAEGRTLLCVLQNVWAVDLDISAALVSEPEWDGALSTTAGLVKRGREDGALSTTTRGFLRIEVSVELRSNVYRNALHRSAPFSLFIDPSDARAYGASWCVYEEGAVVDCKYPRVGGSSRGREGSSEPRRGAYRASLDVNDFLSAGTVVALDVATMNDRGVTEEGVDECLGYCDTKEVEAGASET